MLILWISAIIGWILLSLLVWQLLDDYRYRLIKWLNKKFKMKYKIGDRLLFTTKEGNKIMVKVVAYFRDSWKGKEKENTYFVEPLYYTKPKDVPMEHWIYGVDYFDRLHIPEKDLEEIQ